jgi:hypothetical protein
MPELCIHMASSLFANCGCGSILFKHCICTVPTLLIESLSSTSDTNTDIDVFTSVSHFGTGNFLSYHDR